MAKISSLRSNIGSGLSDKVKIPINSCLVLEPLEPRLLLDGAIPALDLFEYVNVGLGTTYAVNDVALGAEGEIFVAGSATNTSGTVSQGDFNQVIRNHSGSRDGFVARITADGQGDWITFLGGSDTDEIDFINIDTQGAIWVAGDTTSYEDFPFDTGQPVGGRFVAQLNSQGTLVWASSLGGYEGPEVGNWSYSTIANQIQFDPDGWLDIFSYIQTETENYYGVASFNSTGTIEEIGHFNYEYQDLANPNIRFAKVMSPNQVLAVSQSSSPYSFDVMLLETDSHTSTATMPGFVQEVTLDNQGNLLVTGYKNEYPDEDGFIAKFDSMGELLWTVDMGGSSRDRCYAIATDEQGNVYFNGYSESWSDFPLVNALSLDQTSASFLGALSSDGQILWNTRLGLIDGNWLGAPGFAGVDADEEGVVYADTSYNSAARQTALMVHRITLSSGPTLPVASLDTDFIYDDYAYLNEINEAGYLDIRFEDTDSKTVNGDEFVLSGPGAENVSIKGKPRLIDSENNIYRYTLDGDFGSGPVVMEYGASGFSGSEGQGNIAASQTFRVIPDIAPLQFSINTSEFEWDDSEQEFIYEGEISIGLIPSEGSAFTPAITLVGGSLSVDEDAVYGEGTVWTTLTGNSINLFQGSFEIKRGQAQTYLLQDNHVLDDSEFLLAGQDYQFTAFSLATAGQLRAQGAINLSSNLGAVQLAVSGNHWITFSATGIGLTGGTLTLPNVDINTEYMEMKAESLSVEYVAATPASGATPAKPDALRFRGKVTLPSVFGATADLTQDLFAGTDGYIEVNANGEIKWYGKLSIEEIVIVPDLWEIKEATLELREGTGGTMVVAGNGKAVVPPGMEIVCGLGFVNDQFNYIRLGVGDLNLPIGTTGAFLQEINGTVNNLADPDPINIYFGGGLAFTAGPELGIALPEWAGGDLTGRLAEFGVEGGFTMSTLTGSGTLKMIGGLAEGAAVSTLDWDKGTLDAKCTLTALSNLVTITGSMKADKAMNVNVVGQGVVTVPSVVPVWGGRQIANANVMIVYVNDEAGSYSNDYVAGWGETVLSIFGKERKFTTGIRVNLDGTWSFLGGKTAARLQAGLSAAPPSDGILRLMLAEPLADAAYTNSEMFYATEGQEWLMINAQWDNAAAGEISLTDPNGVVYDLAAITNSDFIAVVPELSDDTTTTLFIESPTPGTWTLQVASDEPLEGLTFDGYQDTTLPQLTIDEISINPYSQSGAIAYSGDSDLTDCQITFYYDDDNSGADGILMGQADNTGQFDWDTSSVAAGAYYVYGLISDGNNIPTASYYDEPIEIEASQALTDILIGTGAAGRISYTDADNTLVTVSLKGDGGTLRFTGDDITATGTKNVVVTGTNLFLQSIVLDGTGIAALSIGAKGGSDNEATIGAITGGEIKSLSGKGVVLAGNLQTSGSLSTLSWGDLGDNITIETGQAGSGFSLKAGNIGDNVTFDIADSIKSFSANTYASGRVDCDSLGKFAIKSGPVEVDITTDSGDVGSVGSSGDLLGSLTAAGEIKAVAVKSGALKASLTATGAVGKVSALTIEGATLTARSVGSIAGKGDILDLTLVTTGGDIKSIKAAGDVDLQASIAGSFGSLGTKGDLSGVIRAENMISGVSAGSMSAILSAGGNIGKVSLKGDMTDSWLMAGLDLGSDLVFSSDDTGSGGDIGSVAVSGAFTSSYLLAGALPEVSLTADSALTAPWFAPTGAIGSVKFGQINYTNDEPFGLFAAIAIKPFKVGNVLVESREKFEITVQ